MIQPERNTKSVSLPIQWQNLKSKPHLVENYKHTTTAARRKQEEKEHKFVRRARSQHFTSSFLQFTGCMNGKRIVTISEHVGDET